MHPKKVVLAKNNSMSKRYNGIQRSTGIRGFLQNLLSPYQKYILGPLIKDFVASRIKQLESKIIIQQAILDGLEPNQETPIDIYSFRKISETQACIKQLYLLKQQAESDLRTLSASS